MCVSELQIISILQVGGDKMKHEEMPVGFAMALAMNPDAMQKFSALSETQKQEIIAGTHDVKSREEMHRYVNSLAGNHK